ncbi:cytosolic endo-beta-N-acetylglucosaminidase isoform X1 [Bacillus rossius redtenbacheri]|uniref:cytosolic endo-beta-N-acetylglucosaminidase isoform X1 n=1 Tax=Bacillus rossius redtenbacheri TaxID=93214 RepID=UPI002FDD70B3
MMCSNHGVCTTERGEFICKPYMTYSEVKNCCCVLNNIAWSVLPLQPRTEISLSSTVMVCHQFDSNVEITCVDKNSFPKTLFCHDLKGGYLEDRFVNGSTVHDEYRFFHWAGIDTFVYFSHHFITVPPPVWITAAHLHGVKILGTVITEWKDGEAIWKEVLGSDDCVRQFADRLVDICLHFSFDGYLLNVENAIVKDSVPRLVMFVELLCAKLKLKLPHAEVVWYDSVTVDGDLKWQDELNDLNRTFFDHCDGIFLNYCWTDEKLKNTAMSAGCRKHDVYVGVDVFGRGCFGGGGFNTCKAMEVVRAHGLSAALFAPGWVHEFLGKENFATHEYVFWQKLWSFLHPHGPCKLPFSTSFCQGFGNKLYHRGAVVSDTPWYNLGRQQHQPSVASCLSDECVAEVCQEREAVGEGSDQQAEVSDARRTESHGGCLHHCQHDGFCGGGCLEITMPAGCGSSRHTKQLLILVNGSSEHSNYQENDSCVVRPLMENEAQQLNPNVVLMTGSHGWIVSHYMLNINGVIRTVGAELRGSGGSALLGYISLSPVELQHKEH